MPSTEEFKINSLYLTCSIILLSFFDLYSQNYGSIFSYFGILLYYGFFSKYGSYHVRGLVVLSISAASVSLLSTPVNPLTWAATSISLMILSQNFDKHETTIKDAFTIILKFNLFSFYILWYLNFIAGYSINITELLGLEPQRTIGDVTILRPTGLLLEPNSYCLLIYSILLVLKRFQLKTHSYLFYGSIISIALSQSFFALALLPILIFLYRPQGIFSESYKSLVLLILISLIVWANTGYFESRIDKIMYTNDLSYLIRIGDYDSWISEYSLFGVGFNFIDWESPSILLAWLMQRAGLIFSTILVMILFIRAMRHRVTLGILYLSPYLFTQPVNTKWFFALSASIWLSRPKE